MKRAREDNIRYGRLRAVPGGLYDTVASSLAAYLYNRNHPYAQEVTSAKYSASDIKGGNIAKIARVANESGTTLSSNRGEGWGTSNPSGNGRSVSISPLKIEKNVVPNVVGMGLNDALFILEKCGLEVNISGHGKVVSQSIEPQTAITGKKRRITIKLE